MQFLILYQPVPSQISLFLTIIKIMFGCCTKGKAKAKHLGSSVKIAPVTITIPDPSQEQQRCKPETMHLLSRKDSRETLSVNSVHPKPVSDYGGASIGMGSPENHQYQRNLTADKRDNHIVITEGGKMIPNTSPLRQHESPYGQRQGDDFYNGPPQIQMINTASPDGRHQFLQTKNRASSVIMKSLSKQNPLQASKALPFKRMTSIKSPYFEQPKSLGIAKNTSAEKMYKLAATAEMSKILQHKESFSMVGECISFADDVSQSTKTVKHEKFSRKNRFVCTFCLGKACTKERWEKCANPVIRGLHSNMIEDKLIGSQRPNKGKVENFQVIDQMLELRIGMMINLQEPGEHALCGEGIDDKIGFSYDPMVFQARGISTFNWFWEDLTCPNNDVVLMICQNISRFDQMGKRIFVHCHAGTGRTGLVIASYLLYSGNSETGPEAIEKVRTQRPGSLSKKSQRQFVIDFGQWLAQKRQSFFPEADFFGKCIAYSTMMKDNLQLVHGQDIQDFRYFPKFLGICLNQILAKKEDSSLTIAEFMRCYQCFQSSNTIGLQAAETIKSVVEKDVWVDNWTSLRAVTDHQVLFVAIFVFLKRFESNREKEVMLPKDRTLAEQKRELTFHLGLVYFFARLFLFLQGNDSSQEYTSSLEANETCLMTMAELIPANRKDIEKEPRVGDHHAQTVHQIKYFKQKIEQSTGEPSLFKIIQGEVSSTFRDQQSHKPSAIALASIVRQVTRTRHLSKTILTSSQLNEPTTTMSQFFDNKKGSVQTQIGENNSFQDVPTVPLLMGLKSISTPVLPQTTSPGLAVQTTSPGLAVQTTSPGLANNQLNDYQDSSIATPAKTIQTGAQVIQEESDLQ